ncbi:hypothetical protein [Gordonia phthalatica]|uniref:Uncharacterized protein n=1 Tax=Gordonia phthalatica TaxID=1136941 RepID=A0A0N9NHJ0_9ACTN|nr:hypothetical protein [Gordonia phthalatica]ALG84925.1 hypothetical protein ACH46_10995 [Gordonia phthalatica]
MANGKGEADGCLGMAGLVVLVMVIGVLTMIPKAVWIGLGVLVGIGVLVWIAMVIAETVAGNRRERAIRAENTRVAQAAAAVTRRVEVLGATNARHVETALAAADRIANSEAAQEGWLGEVDFSEDIRGIEEAFGRSQELRSVAIELQALPNPTPADRRLLAEAVTAAKGLDRNGRERADLIARCADEADRIDESLREEKERTRTEEQRDELQRKLNSMLYGVEASAIAEPADSVADQVLARVAGYREIKQQIADTRLS